MRKWLREPATKDWIEGILVGAGIGIGGIIALTVMLVMLR